MTTGKLTRTLAAGLIAAMLSACGGGGVATTSPIPKTGSGKTSQVAMTFHFNTNTGTAARGRRYVSRSTKGVGISYLVHGAGTLPATQAAMATPTYATQVGISYVASNTTCTGDLGNGAFDCTVLFAAPVGYDDFQITTWDAAPSISGYGGNFTGDNNLSTNNMLNQLILQDETNQFNLALDGIVASVYLSVNPNQLLAGANPPVDVTLNVFAKDADGNVIIGSDPYVDLNGAPLTITVNAPAVTLPGTPVGTPGTLTFAGGAPTTFTSPAVQATTIVYNGGDIVSGSFTGSTAATSVPVYAATLNFTRTTDGPITITGSPTINSYPILGSDNSKIVKGLTPTDLWAVGFGGGIVTFSTGGAVINSALPGGDPTGIALGSDGNFWASTVTSNAILRINPTTFPAGGSIHAYSAGITGSELRNITLGPDGNMWFTEEGPCEGGTVLAGPYCIGYVIPAPIGGNPPTIVECPLTGEATPSGTWDITTDGTNMWFSEVNGDIATVNTSCGAYHEYAPPAGMTHGYDLLVAPDGNIWFDDYTDQMIAVMSKTGAILKTFATTGNPVDMTVGPDDNVWVAESGAENAILRISTDGTYTLQKFTYEVAGTPYAITTGPDGNIWFTDSTGSNAEQLVLP